MTSQFDQFELGSNEIYALMDISEGAFDIDGNEEAFESLQGQGLAVEADWGAADMTIAGECVLRAILEESESDDFDGLSVLVSFTDDELCDARVEFLEED